MKTSTFVAVLAPSVASAQWWGGAPQCAQSCLSSAYATTTTGAVWPAQSDYCVASKGAQVSSCLTSACSATSTAIASYSSLSSSLCSEWSSCTSAGSTGVHTLTYSGGPVTWGVPDGWGSGGGFGGGGFGGPGGFGGASASIYSEWANAFSGSTTWTGGVVTVTGCVGDGSPWYAGPNGGWNNVGGFNGWVGWGNGWSIASTVTTTVTYTTTNSAGVKTTVTGLATVGAAVSGTLTTSTTFGSPTATGDSTPTGNAAARVGGRVGGSSYGQGSVVTGMMGIALGGVFVIASML